MSRRIFVNLPVKDLDRSVAFFSALGFAFNPRFTDANATCMIVADDIFVMLLVEPFFQTFIKKPISDAKRSTEVIVCLSCANRTEVDDLVGKAITAGASTHEESKDLGFMYQHGFEDLDGHLWELVYMDPAAAGSV